MDSSSKLLFVSIVLMIFAMPLAANVGKAQEEMIEYDTEHNFKLNWVHTYQGVIRQVYEVEMQNLEEISRLAPLKLIFDDLSGNVNYIKFYMWKGVPTEVTVYDKEFVKATFLIEGVISYENVGSLDGYTYDRFVGNPSGGNWSIFYRESEDLGTGYENLIEIDSNTYKIEYVVEHLNPRLEIRDICTWIEMPTIFLDRKAYDENHYVGDYSFPSLGSSAIKDQQGITETENGTIRFKIDFEIGSPWGSSGYVGLIDPDYPEGLSVETWALTRPDEPEPPIPSITLPENIEEDLDEIQEEIEDLYEIARQYALVKIMENLIRENERIEELKVVAEELQEYYDGLQLSYEANENYQQSMYDNMFMFSFATLLSVGKLEASMNVSNLEIALLREDVSRLNDRQSPNLILVVIATVSTTILGILAGVFLWKRKK